MVIDFRRTQPMHSPIYINRTAVETIQNTKFLGFLVADNLPCSLHTSSLERLISTHPSSSSCIESVLKTIRVTLPHIEDLAQKCLLAKANSILRDSTHPGLKLFSFLHSGWKYSRSVRFNKSFYPAAITLLNQLTHC